MNIIYLKKTFDILTSQDYLIFRAEHNLKKKFPLPSFPACQAKFDKQNQP